ncbi:hypothetical protein [Actinobacillus vicugnae]|uniref:hypothetical protein n=1 Tax=Actinobacillus vicugnae TaxID=2573093 RepID=UPI0012412F29|nr:hypothetical protein [Actinobacillus vicugnae]
MTSTDKAEDNHKNRFSTGTLNATNLENHAEYKGSSIGVSGSIAMNFDTPLGNKESGIAQSHKQAENEKGEKIYEAEGIQNTNGVGDPVLATGWDSLQTSLGFGLGHTSGNSQSVSQSGINTSNIEIRDSQIQLEKTGKTAEKIVEQVKTDITTENAENRSGKLENRFDKDKVLKELNIQVKVTQDFRKNAFSVIDAYVLPKQAELREEVKKAKNEEEKTALYNEIYKLQYQKRLLETTVGIIAGSPEIAITQGTLQLAATKMREETLKNSRLFAGIKDEKTGQVLRNDSYDSGYFDGVKLGGVRIDLDVICNSGMGSCSQSRDGEVIFKGKDNYSIYDAIDPMQNKKAGSLYGETGGFQSVEGGWYLGGKPLLTYKPGDISDFAVESFAGTHDMLGGQIWGWYDKLGNTSEKTPIQSVTSQVTTVVAIPVSAPFATTDLMSSDFFEVLMKIGGQ